MNCMISNEGSAYPETLNNHQNRKDAWNIDRFTAKCPAQHGWSVSVQHFAVWKVDGLRTGNINILRATF